MSPAATPLHTRSDPSGLDRGCGCYDRFVLLLDAPITLREVMTREEVPLADVFREVGHFLIGREDVVLFGAQAVNVYAETERMTQDVDLLSTRAEMVVEELRVRLADRFRIAARVRAVVPGASYRLYPLRKPKNRHLVDVRRVDTLSPFRVVEGCGSRRRKSSWR
jgi:hypothetical protein